MYKYNIGYFKNAKNLKFKSNNIMQCFLLNHNNETKIAKIASEYFDSASKIPSWASNFSERHMIWILNVEKNLLSCKIWFFFKSRWKKYYFIHIFYVHMFTYVKNYFYTMMWFYKIRMECISPNTSGATSRGGEDLFTTNILVQ